MSEGKENKIEGEKEKGGRKRSFRSCLSFCLCLNPLSLSLLFGERKNAKKESSAPVYLPDMSV